MFNKEKILEMLNQDDLFIDNFILEAFIKNWKIDPIYEDAAGVEYYDEMAVEKIRNGIKQKSQPKFEINIMDKDEIKPVDMSVEIPVDIPVEESIESESTSQEENTEEPQEVEHEIVQVEASVPSEPRQASENELTNVTLDISNQTLAILAESIAKKITTDVADYIKRTDFIEDAVSLGEYKKDNQLLVQKVEELLRDNKVLVRRMEQLDSENRSFVKLFGNIYIKNQ